VFTSPAEVSTYFVSPPFNDHRSWRSHEERPRRHDHHLRAILALPERIPRLSFQDHCSAAPEKTRREGRAVDLPPSRARTCPRRSGRKRAVKAGPCATAARSRADLPQPDSLTRNTRLFVNVSSSLSRSSQRPISCSGDCGSSFSASASTRRDAFASRERRTTAAIIEAARNTKDSSGHDHARGLRSRACFQTPIAAVRRRPAAVSAPLH
jgi:hypothetical protein